MTIGLQIQAAGRASMGAYTQVIFALILEQVVFGTVPVPLSMFGTALILGSALYIAVVKEERDSGTGKVALPEGNGERYVDEEGLLGLPEGRDTDIIG